jgi:hypothetical protein
LEKFQNIFKTSYDITIVIGSECAEREREKERRRMRGKM